MRNLKIMQSNIISDLFGNGLTYGLVQNDWTYNLPAIKQFTRAWT